MSINFFNLFKRKKKVPCKHELATFVSLLDTDTGYKFDSIVKNGITYYPAWYRCKSCDEKFIGYYSLPNMDYVPEYKIINDKKDMIIFNFMQKGNTTDE